MLRTLKTIAGAFLLLGLAQLPALAAGPLDGEFGVVWWQTDFDRNTDLENVSVGAGAPGFRGELWFFNKLGVRAAMYSSDLGDLNEDDAGYLSADVFWKVFSPSENNFLALGLGYQDMEFTESGITPILVQTTGARATADGRIGIFGMMQVYGNYSLLLELDDYSQPGTGDVYTDLDGQEYELGLAWKFGPFVDVRAGYRSTELDFTHQPPAALEYSGSVNSSGFLVGMGVHF